MAKVTTSRQRVEKNVLDYFCLLMLMLYVPVNNLSVMLGCFPVFLGLTSAKQRMKFLTQEHNTVPTS